MVAGDFAAVALAVVVVAGFALSFFTLFALPLVSFDVTPATLFFLGGVASFFDRRH